MEETFPSVTDQLAIKRSAIASNNLGFLKEQPVDWLEKIIWLDATTIWTNTANN